jgi:predicted nucleotidyltransferase
MNFPTLLFSTDNPTIDRVVSGLIAIFEHLFPNRVAGYYLLGSYANGTALPSSDLDLVMLFRDRFASEHEFTTAVTINESCKLIAPVVLDAWVISDERTQQPVSRAIA